MDNINFEKQNTNGSINLWDCLCSHIKICWHVPRWIGIVPFGYSHTLCKQIHAGYVPLCIHFIIGSMQVMCLHTAHILIIGAVVSLIFIITRGQVILGWLFKYKNLGNKFLNLKYLTSCINKIPLISCIMLEFLVSNYFCRYYCGVRNLCL